MPPQVLERDYVQRPFVRRRQHDRRRGAVKQRLPPADRDHAPAIAGHEPWETVFGSRRTEVVADLPLVIQEFLRHDGTDDVLTDILGAGRAHAISKETRHRVDSAGFEFATQHVAVGHRESVPREMVGNAAGSR